MNKSGSRFLIELELLGRIDALNNQGFSEYPLTEHRLYLYPNCHD